MSFKIAALSVAAIAALSGTANADVNIILPGPYVFSGPQTHAFETTEIEGTLTGVSISFDFSDAQSATWVSDVVLGISGISWGGFDEFFGNVDQGEWPGLPTGGTSGFYSSTALVTDGPAPTYNGEIVPFIIGNGWSGSAGGFTLNNVEVTLHGIEKVPAPGALALLGLGGLAAARRRR